MSAKANPAADLSQAARRRFLAREKRPLLTADWTRALFLHYEVPAECLQPYVPLDLDLWEGKAFVSLVAFSMEHLHPGFGGPLGRWLFRPIASHEFFNVRTYVQREGVPGIFFISEWLNNRWSVLGGPIIYGLPYKFAPILYEHRPAQGRVAGKVGETFDYTAEIERDISFEICASGGLDEFLIERYTAFTRHGRRSRYFDIWHEPWRQAPVEAHIRNDRLLRHNFPWFAHTRLAGAHYSPGVRHVWMGAPHSIGHISSHETNEMR